MQVSMVTELLLVLAFLHVFLHYGTFLFSHCQGVTTGAGIHFLYVPFSLFFLIVVLLDTGRVPFDLLEAESELVAGVYTEFSGIFFAIFFLAEYSNIIMLAHSPVNSLVVLW